ncbi:MAG: RNA polymerase sigma factor, partial [Deltaproteobacteria bacterium]
MNEEETDKLLWMRMRRGDPDAVAVVIRRHARALHAFIYRHVRNEADAEDLLQETWLRMIRNLDRFDPRYTFS